jgi:hypothetical protein
MRGILFAMKELGDPRNDSSQRAPCSLHLLDPVVRLLSFNGVIVDRFVAFFSAHEIPPFICEPSLISTPDALGDLPAPVALVAESAPTRRAGTKTGASADADVRIEQITSPANHPARVQYSGRTSAASDQAATRRHLRPWQNLPRHPLTTIQRAT